MFAVSLGQMLPQCVKKRSTTNYLSGLIIQTHGIAQLILQMDIGFVPDAVCDFFAIYYAGNRVSSKNLLGISTALSLAYFKRR
jgi:hypothetical protein